MAKFHMIQTGFWNDPKVMEEMTPEDKFFFMYLLTNPQVTQIGIYRITKKQGSSRSRTGAGTTSRVGANRCLIVFERN